MKSYTKHKGRKEMHRFTLQNRYQDSQWEDAGHTDFYEEQPARIEAKILSKDSICYGMMRVVNLETSRVVATFSAGKEI
jgi:hypothetical protein